MLKPLRGTGVVVQNNEGRACDAVVTLLESRSGSMRSDVWLPEKDGVAPLVDLRFRLGTQPYAIEHTRIETFPGQIQTSVDFRRFVDPVIEELSGQLPKPGIYNLYFPLPHRLGVTANQLERVRKDFITWVREQAQHLHERNPERPIREWHPRGFDEQYRAVPPGFPHEVTLRREAHWARTSRHEGVLLAALIAPQDVEAQRVRRLQDALDRKCPKLQICKDEGARTILILEDGDIYLSNEILIGDALARLLNQRADVPDEIYLVQTAIGRWTVHSVKDGDNDSPEVDWSEFDSSELTDITARSAYD
jgi:hypothetical protein